MSNFIVSARKYRPDNFDTVVGQDSITTTLKNSIKIGHLAHAYLFCGPRGVGKTTCARIFAKTINCMNLTEKTEACNSCDSCISFNKSSSFNIHELDAASNNSVDDIRNLIEQVRIPPQVGKYSVYIIDEVHMLSNQAFNSFLKTLEEPPKHAIFILATTEKHKILPTILSRCQIFDFQRIELKDIVTHLQNIAIKENISADPDGLNIIAQKADGALRDALSIFDQMVSFSGDHFTYNDVINNLNIIDYEYYFRFTGYFLESDIPSSLKLYDQILKKGFEGSSLVNGLNKHFRDLLMCKDHETVVLLEVGESQRQRYIAQSDRCSVDFLYKALMILNQADISYKTSTNKRLFLELTLLQLSRILENNPVSQPVQRKEPVEKKEKPEEKKAPEEIQQKTEKNSLPEINKTESTEKNYKGTVSIKDIVHDNSSRKESVPEEKQEIKKTEAESKRNEDFSFDDLSKVWNEFASKYKEKELRKYTLLTANKFVLKENKLTEFTVSSMIQKEVFEKEILNELTYELKTRLKNDFLSINVIISEVKETDTKKLYTDEDKYNHLKEINPSLDKLRQQFNLDFK